jgi:hypothetical protein
MSLKVLDDACSIGLSRIFEVVASKKVKNFKACNLAVFVSVYSLKRRVWLKID